MNKKALLFCCISVLSITSLNADAAMPKPQMQFFDRLTALCGQAFSGQVAADVPNDSGTFKDEELIMHVRECSETEIRIPFHVGDDRSRTWVITKTANGLKLKHDHRHEDGSEDTLTQYGGTTTDIGTNAVQSFPADNETKALFDQENIPVSKDNIWQVGVQQGRFMYRLIRPNREVRVDFDLTTPMTAPPAPWGSEPVG